MSLYDRSPKDILKGRIKFWKTYGFKEPTFQDILEEKFKQENNSLITLELMRKYSRSFDEVDYFAHYSGNKIVEDLIEVGKPEYGFIHYLCSRPKEPNVTILCMEEMLTKCLGGLEKKFGKRKAKLLREKFNIKTVENIKDMCKNREIK